GKWRCWIAARIISGRFDGFVHAIDPRSLCPVARGVSMTALARQAGQLLSVGFDGPTLPEELRDRIAAGAVGGVMLFRPNITAHGQDPASGLGPVARLVAA